MDSVLLSYHLVWNLSSSISSHLIFLILLPFCPALCLVFCFSFFTFLFGPALQLLLHLLLLHLLILLLSSMLSWPQQLMLCLFSYCNCCWYSCLWRCSCGSFFYVTALASWVLYLVRYRENGKHLMKAWMYFNGSWSFVKHFYIPSFVQYIFTRLLTFFKLLQISSGLAWFPRLYLTQEW